MSFEDLTVEHLDVVNKVVEKYLAGTPETQISKELAIPRQKVVGYINEWRAMASDNAAIRARAKEALVGADTHYSKLIQKAYEVMDEATMASDLRSKNSAIKLVMDLERTRIDMLQKAGLLENKELAEEMMAIEDRQDTLIGILKDIASEHPEIRDEILRRLSSATKPGETVTIVSGE